MNKTDITAKIEEKAGISKKAAEAIDVFTSTVTEAVSSGGKAVKDVVNAPKTKDKKK